MGTRVRVRPIPWSSPDAHPSGGNPSLSHRWTKWHSRLMAPIESRTPDWRMGFGVCLFQAHGRGYPAVSGAHASVASCCTPMNTVLWLNAVTFSSPWPTFLHIRTDYGMHESG